MTASLKVKNDKFYAVINYKAGSAYKQKWISLGLPAKNNKRRAEAMLEEIRLKFEEEYSTPGGDMLFVVYIRRWLEKKKPLIELSTWEGYQIYAERHIIPYFEPMGLTLREVKPHHIKQYYDYKFVNGRLDDEDDMLNEQLSHFVQTNPNFGFGLSDFEKCGEIFMRDKGKGGSLA